MLFLAILCQIRFNAIEFGDSFNCSRGSVEVFNGGLASSPSVGKYCTPTRPSDFISQSNTARIQFHTDADVPLARGFRLMYRFETTGKTTC